MFERLQRLYTDGKLTQQGLDNAVFKGWITNDEKQIIMEELQKWTAEREGT